MPFEGGRRWLCLIRAGSVAQQRSSEKSSGRREDRCSFNADDARAAAANATRGSTALRTVVRIFVAGDDGRGYSINATENECK